MNVALDRPAAGPEGDATGGRRPVVLLAEPDPYLAFLLHLNVPEASVLEVETPGQLAALLEEKPDLVVVNLQSRAASALVARAGSVNVLGILDAGTPRAPATPGVEGVLVRPFLPGEFREAVLRALGRLSASRRGSRSAPRLTPRWSAAAAMAMLVVAAVVQLTTGNVSGVRPFVLALAIAYGIGRIAAPSASRWVTYVDVAVASLVLAMTGGRSSEYVAYGFVVVASAGAVLGAHRGGLAGLAVAVSSAYGLAQDVVQARATAAELVCWLALFPLSGMAAASAMGLRKMGGHAGAGLLAEANAVLSTLYGIARTMPGGLDVGSVASAAMTELQDTLRAPAGLLLVREVGTLVVAASFGVAEPERLAAALTEAGLDPRLEHGAVELLDRDAASPQTIDALGAPACWFVAPLQRAGRSFGIIFSACPDHDRHHANRAFIKGLAQETAVALENAQLFGRVRELSIDQERRRLARDIHDGVAQALAHVRLELDFIGRHGAAGHEGIRREIERLSRVVDRSLADVRSMTHGLRAGLSAQGLAGSLHAYLQDLRGLGGPDITLQVAGTPRLHPEAEGEVFRIAQEAVSNALRHSRAREVHVVIVASDGGLTLRVEDDGAGIRAEPAGPRSGVGLKAMQERANEIGAVLSIGRRPGGGTVVELRVPYAEEGP